MSLECVTGQSVQITIVYEHSMMIAVSTNSPLIDHFLRKVKMSRSRHTWINYAHDLKVFFTTLSLPLEQIDRHSCLRFMELQDQAGLSSLTINRRLAAVSSLFHELNLLDPVLFPQNPVAPLQRNRTMYRRGSPSLYRKQPQRVPDVISEEDLRSFFAVLPTWRDRTLVLLMWMSCLRINEEVSAWLSGSRSTMWCVSRFTRTVPKRWLRQSEKSSIQKIEYRLLWEIWQRHDPAQKRLPSALHAQTNSQFVSPSATGRQCHRVAACSLSRTVMRAHGSTNCGKRSVKTLRSQS